MNDYNCLSIFASSPNLLFLKSEILDLTDHILEKFASQQEEHWPSKNQMFDWINISDTNKDLKKVIDYLISNAFPVHSKFNLSLFNCPPTPISVLSEMLISLLDNNCASYNKTMIFGRIEREVVHYITAIMKKKNAFVLFVPSGTLANLQGLMLFRDLLFKKFRRIVIISSDESHFSISRTAKILGKNVGMVTVKTDNDARIDLNNLEALLNKLQTKRIGAIVVSTFGTTYSGTIDPIADIVEICQKYKALHHCDAAYGGVSIFSKLFNGYTKILSKVPSITIDFHKWMYLPNTTSLLIFDSLDQARESFSIKGWSVNKDIEFEPYLHGIMTSRRADFFKVWLHFAILGKKELAKFIEHNLSCAKELKRQLKKGGYQVFSGCDLSIVCCRLRDTSPNDRIYKVVEESLEKNGIYISNTILKGKEWWRFCFCNLVLELSDITELFQEFDKVVQQYVSNK
jgi:glutamate/tyrosine decarboxylase-like PLP-dependent enzyme